MRLADVAHVKEQEQEQKQICKESRSRKSHELMKGKAMSRLPGKAKVSG